MSTELTKKSKKLAYFLRHNPQEAGIELHENGWCHDVPKLLRSLDMTERDLLNLVAADKKGRYAVKLQDHRLVSIAANQGHTVKDIKLSFEEGIPPPTLFHGSTEKAAASILKNGLLKMQRHHVHLSADIETARQVASRRKDVPVIFIVSTSKMVQLGVKFYVSPNLVWLVEHVPPEFLEELK